MNLRMFRVSLAGIAVTFACNKGPAASDPVSDPAFGAAGCEAKALPDIPPAAGQVVFTLPGDVDPCSVAGYIVGYKDQLKVQRSNDGQYLINNVPAGDHDVVITAGTVAIQLLGEETKERGRRLKKVGFLSGVRTEPGEIDVPTLGSMSGLAKLVGQTDHSGIDVYVPGTDLLAKTDSTGAFSISGVPVGEHNLYFE